MEDLQENATNSEGNGALKSLLETASPPPNLKTTSFFLPRKLFLELPGDAEGLEAEPRVEREMLEVL